jgi:hypothetical protein
MNAMASESSLTLPASLKRSFNMLEGFILIIFFLIGLLASLLAVLFFVFAAIRGSKTMLKTGLFVTIIPLSLFFISYWFYEIYIPKINKQVERLYVGTYVMLPQVDEKPDIDNKMRPRLILNSDNTFQLDRNDLIPFHGKGTWRAGETEDGHFGFRDIKDSTIFLAEPLNSNKLGVGIEGLNTQTIEFEK